MESAYLKVPGRMRRVLFYGSMTALFAGCSDDATYTDRSLALEVPAHFPPLAYDIAGNPPTEKGFELGRKLFYDGRLASDGLVSCAFCHIQENAFTHHGHTVSHGVEDRMGTRNALPIQNLAFFTTFMWDGATNSLELQPIIPLTSHIEMDGDLTAIVTMMKADPEYRELYRRAFANGEVNTENMLRALAQFMAMAVSANARFDQYRRHEPGGELTAEEQAGLALFDAKCASCHTGALQTDGSFRNNGLPPNPLVYDTGRFAVSGKEEDRYRFRVPSLRNVEVTAPYMHDGRFGTLRRVLDHYASGVADSPTLDPALRHGGGTGIPLTEAEKAQLISFLKTLTDHDFLQDKRFAPY